jgi:predicted SprT family Zn-dependent metalloprotease
MNRASVISALQRHLPPNAVDYCLDLWERNNFVFQVKNPRRSKLGDYRYVPTSGRHYISVNKDLNPYAFLITYLHEVAHLLTFRKHGRRAKPHGIQWKRNFRDITYPVMTPSVFPEALL